MTKEQKQAAVTAVEKGANITYRLAGLNEGECCVLGSMLLECGVTRDEIKHSGAATWQKFYLVWKQLLHDKFGLNQGRADKLMVTNDRINDTCERRRELIRIILTEL